MENDRAGVARGRRRISGIAFERPAIGSSTGARTSGRPQDGRAENLAKKEELWVRAEALAK